MEVPALLAVTTGATGTMTAQRPQLLAALHHVAGGVTVKSRDHQLMPRLTRALVRVKGRLMQAAPHPEEPAVAEFRPPWEAPLTARRVACMNTLTVRTTFTGAVGDSATFATFAWEYANCLDFEYHV